MALQESPEREYLLAYRELPVAASRGAMGLEYKWWLEPHGTISEHASRALEEWKARELARWRTTADSGRRRCQRCWQWLCIPFSTVLTEGPSETMFEWFWYVADLFLHRSRVFEKCLTAGSFGMSDFGWSDGCELCLKT